MSKRTLIIFGTAIFLVGLSTGLALANWKRSAETPHVKTLLDNQRVTVTEVTMAPGARREPYVRPTDQIIVFIDDADYETTDTANKKLVKHRAAGEIIWHNKGEDGPLLINIGKKPYRNLVVALK